MQPLAKSNQHPALGEQCIWCLPNPKTQRLARLFYGSPLERLVGPEISNAQTHPTILTRCSPRLKSAGSKEVTPSIVMAKISWRPRTRTCLMIRRALGLLSASFESDPDFPAGTFRQWMMRKEASQPFRHAFGVDDL
jgi:hypothetical protein